MIKEREKKIKSDNSECCSSRKSGNPSPLKIMLQHNFSLVSGENIERTRNDRTHYTSNELCQQAVLL